MRVSKPDAGSKEMAFVEPLLNWFVTEARDLPWRRTDDPYAVWVSEIMLQQTQVKTVIPYWERWMRELPTIESLATAAPERIHKLWEGLGYYTRVRNMQKAARQIVSEHAGKFPDAFEAILDLPGIGRYTAGAISSIAFNHPKPILDGNVIRVLTRLFGIKGDPREPNTNQKLWSLSEKLVSLAATASIGLRRNGATRGSAPTNHAHRHSSAFNQSLMELGALICTPRAPRCSECPVRPHCFAAANNLAESLPRTAKRAAVTHRRFAAFLLAHKGRFLVRQRPAGVVNAHLWEFPNVEISNGTVVLSEAARSALGITPASLHPVCAIRHSITRYRITLEAFQTEARVQPAKPRGTWKTLQQLHRLPFASAHKKILLHISKQTSGRVDSQPSKNRSSR